MVDIQIHDIKEVVLQQREIEVKEGDVFFILEVLVNRNNGEEMRINLFNDSEINVRQKEDVVKIHNK